MSGYVNSFKETIFLSYEKKNNKLIKKYNKYEAKNYLKTKITVTTTENSSIQKYPQKILIVYV